MKTLPPLFMSMLAFISAGILLYANGGMLEAATVFKTMVILTAIAVGTTFIRVAARFADWAAWAIHEMLDKGSV